MTSSTQASLFEQFVDPEDGQLDASQWVLNNSHGFMPLPFAITEPAVGAGGGAALLFFHETEEQKAQRKADPEAARDMPLSVSGVVAGATSNGSYVAGGFHSGNWFDDKVRYFGGLFGASFNLDYHVADGLDPAKFNMEGLYFTQDVDVRIGESNIFVGGSYTYINSETSFDVQEVLPGIDSLNFNSKDANVTLKLTYDDRNNQISPSAGTKAGVAYKLHNPAFGGDFDYKVVHGYVHNYNPLFDNWGLAIRADMKALDGEAPFYARPYVDMRGMPAMRYQGDETALAEVELNYHLNERWTLLGFTGVAKATDAQQSFDDVPTLAMQGAGFRYLMARHLGMKTGVDIAKGPEEWTLYIQFGTAW
ncbi:BamA/TamA family outer membrane protein [Vibrio mexicanus]|uniref:BamA/TamA family outer membrane protein n=1 Tax=Vibrio mexicanus TaxID=1004326 RepID=UPI00063C06E4|nr:BamA/TamA family outer membrane protein [Vibrio mexicanus]